MRQKNRAAPRPRPLPGSASDAFGRAVWEGERAGRGPMILIDDAKSSRSITSFAPRGAVSGRRRCYAVHLDAPRETNDGTVEPSSVGKNKNRRFHRVARSCRTHPFIGRLIAVPAQGHDATLAHSARVCRAPSRGECWCVGRRATAWKSSTVSAFQNGYQYRLTVTTGGSVAVASDQ